MLKGVAMSITDDLAASTRILGGAKCQAGKALADHPDQADEIALAYMSDHSAPQIAKVLTAHQIQVTAASIRRHRRGECACL